VPVLGNVYLPPTAYGGQIQWVRDFVQRDGSGNFPVADKMIEAAEYYGFDGWFINQETAGGDAELASDMRDMLVYFHTHSNLLITWYDAMTSSGAIAWQNQLDAQNQMFFQDGATLVSDDMFLNFNWSATGLTNSATLATSLGRSPYELYAGIDVEANGYNTGVNWAGVFPEGQPHRTSIGFYRPEWTHNSAANLADFYARDNKFWVGPNGDPSNTTTSASWKGVANYIPANSAIDTLPFATTFNTGQGDHFSMYGSRYETGTWNNLSLQDVLPTWRWIMRSTGTPLDVSIDFADSDWGGSSLLVSGDLVDDNDLMLYETNLPIGANTLFEIDWINEKHLAPSRMQLGLAFADDPSNVAWLDVPDAVTEDWNAATLGLSDYAGRTLSAISLRFVGAGTSYPYSVRIGKLAVFEETTLPAPPTDVAVTRYDEIDANHATLRLSWTAPPDPVRMYLVFQTHEGRVSTFLGATPNTVYFVQGIARDPGTSTATIQVVSIGPEFFGSSGAGEVVVTWDHLFANGFDN
jgi:mannosyl-glycoprotein endo-beta-N-acetylglucosaminidase